MGLADGGIIGGLLNGYRTGQQDFQQNQMYEAEMKRRALEDQRQAADDQRRSTAWQEQQDDRAHTLERRPVLEGREDADYGLQAGMRGLQMQNMQHTVDRTPVMDRQQDEEFATQQQMKRAQMGNMGQEQQLNALRIKQAQLGLSDDQLRQQVGVTQRAVGMGLAMFDQTGNPQHLISAFNATYGKATGNTVDKIEPTDAGGYVVHMHSGETLDVADKEHLAHLAASAADPASLIQDMHAAQQREMGIGPHAQEEPADIRAARQLARGMQMQPGETKEQLLNRAYDRVRAKGYTDPNDLHAKVYQQAITELDKSADGLSMSPDQKHQAAMDRADRYVQDMMQRGGRFGVGAAANAGATPGAGAGAQQGNVGAGAAQAPGPHGKIVRTGTDANGQRVAKYEDGTIAPLQ